MGKPKKGRKGNQEDDFGDEVEVDILSKANGEADSDDDEPTPTAKPAAKKGKKAKKKKDDDWEDDIANEIAALSMDANKGVAVDEESVNGNQENLPKKKEKTKKKKQVDEEEEDDIPVVPAGGKKKQIATFSMLDMMEDDDAVSDAEESAEETPVIVPDKKNEKKKKKAYTENEESDLTSEASSVPSSGKQGKKSKKDKKSKKEEEDIDALLAEIDQPTEKSESKKKGKKKKKDEEDEDLPTTQDKEPTESGTSEGLKVTETEVPDTNKTTVEADEEDLENEELGSTVKTAAQKKKEKRERQKLQKQQEKLKGKTKKSTESVEAAKTDATEGKEPTAEGAEAKEAAEPKEEKGSDEEDEGDEKKKKKDKKKKKKEKEEKEKVGKKPGKSAIAAMKELLQKQKEEEERLQREEEERIKREEEARLIKEEEERLEKERKEKKKQKEKERKERLKAEGKLLTEKQKADRRRALQLLQARGLDVGSTEETTAEVKKKRIVYEKKKKRPTPQTETAPDVTTPVTPPVTPATDEDVKEVTPESETPVTPAKEEQVEEVADNWEDEDVKDAWDASDEDEEKESKKEEEKKPAEKSPVKTTVVIETKEDEEEEEEEDSEEESEEESDEEEDDSEEDETESESEDERTPAEKAREKALARIQKRKEDAEENRNIDKLRAPVVCVLGHVDTGKTKILDKLRRTNVQDGEAGGITQQIGATNVPDHAILNNTKMCKEFSKSPLKLPGLLIIDTPGHESFSNLRSRGSSLCDIAILVVDIMHGLEPQTIESINLLKQRKTPFVVALNKIDRLYGWRSNPTADVVNTIKKQAQNTKLEFEDRSREVIVQFAEQSLNAALFYENKNMREYISLVPTSAHTGDGMGNLIALICELSQTLLAKRVSYSEELAATVMEVKAITGLGTTIDVILVNGKVKEGDTIILAGTEGPIVTQIRGCLMPQPMKELRVKGQYEHCKEVMAAQGVKIIAKDLEKALAGLPLYVAQQPDEVEIYKEDITQALGDVLGSIKLSERGVFVQASTLGSLEALLEFLRTSKIPYAGINIGPVHKRDIMKASVMLEHDSQWAVILAFDVKVEREAQEMADSLGVKIFTAEIIYHLFDSFMAHRAELKKRKQEEFKSIAVFPCKVRVLPQFVFNSRDPIVVGVSVEAGVLRVNTPMCVPSKEKEYMGLSQNVPGDEIGMDLASLLEFLEIGRVTSIEVNHKTADTAKKGEEVCVKIEPVPGDSPKMFGRHFDHTDLLMSKISRQSIDAVKDYFREEMSKADWQLMVELKKIFEIL